jgi:hypothetical protein
MKKEKGCEVSISGGEPNTRSASLDRRSTGLPSTLNFLPKCQSIPTCAGGGISPTRAPCPQSSCVPDRPKWHKNALSQTKSNMEDEFPTKTRHNLPREWPRKKLAHFNPSDGDTENPGRLRFRPWKFKIRPKTGHECTANDPSKSSAKTHPLNIAPFQRMAEILLQTDNSAWQAPR